MDARMATQIEIKLGGVANLGVDDGACKIYKKSSEYEQREIEKERWRGEGGRWSSCSHLTRQYVAAPVDRLEILVVVGEQPGVVALLDNHEGHRRLVIRLQGSTGLEGSPQNRKFNQ